MPPATGLITTVIESSVAGVEYLVMPRMQRLIAYFHLRSSDGVAMKHHYCIRVNTSYCRG